MSYSNTSLISSRTASVFLVGGLFIILILGLFTGESMLLSAVLIFGLILAIIFLYNPKWGIFLILLVRSSIDKFSEQFTINFGENLNYNAAAVFGILVVFLLSLYLIKNKREIRDLPIKKLWLLFLGISLLSIVISIDKTSSAYGIIKIISIFLIFSSVYVIVKRENNPNTVLYAIIFSSLVPFLFATYQLITGSGLGGTEGVESRLFGTFSHPNPFASFVLITLSITLFLMLKAKDHQKKWLLGILFFWGIIILEQTYARGAWLAFLIFLFIITFKKSPRVLLGIIIASVMLFFISTSIQERVQDIYNPPADSSVRWRFEQWNRIYSAYVKKPLTGYGIGTETVVHENEFGPNAGNQYTHNDFLRIALETGIFGFLIYFMLLFFTFIKLFRSYIKEKNPYLKDFGLFALTLYIGLLSYSLTNNNLNETVTQWLMWGIIGAVFALYSANKETKRDN